MTALDVLLTCMRDAAERAGLHVEIEQHSSIDGIHVLVYRADPRRPLLIATAIDPSDSAFDESLRDHMRNVAARMKVPFALVSSFRTCVLYNVDAVTRRSNVEDQVLMSEKGTDVLIVDEVLSSARRVAFTESLRLCIVKAASVEKITGSAEQSAVMMALSKSDGRRPADYFSERMAWLLTDILSCTNGKPASKESVVKLATGILGHTLVRLQHPGDLDPLLLPPGMNEPRLMLDIVGAYLREAYRIGHGMFPVSVADIEIEPDKRLLFRSSLMELVHFINDFDLARLDSSALLTAIDGVLSWCTDQSGAPVPTIDAIDLALACADQLMVEKSDFPHVLEVGSTLGAFGIRARLFEPACDTRVYAPTEADERLILLRALGRRGERQDLRIMRRHEETTQPWDLVCISLTHRSERHRLSLLLESLRLSANARIVVFAPLAALRAGEFADIRRVLLEKYQLQWVFTADAEPLASPDNGTCCIIAEVRSTVVARKKKKKPEVVQPEIAQFVFLRSPLSTIIPKASSVGELSAERREQLHVFLRYLTSSERGKINAEVVVRRIPIQELRSRSLDATGGWDDLIIPPDVIASILRKLSNKTQPLCTIADVTGGIRTGANDVLAPSIEEIADEELELRYLENNGTNTVLITSLDEIESIAGIPRSEQRLLLLPEDRALLEGTNVLARILKAESEGVHERPTVKHRKTWWHLPETTVPDLFIPKQQRDRWIIGINTTHAFVTDTFIEITLHDTSLLEQIALWMNSTLGMFLSELVRSHSHVLDITVGDAQEFPIPHDDVLRSIDTKRWRSLLYRPSRSIAEEFGTHDADVVRPHMVMKDRAKLDRFFMIDIFGLNDEEVRWVYRFALAWLSSSTNVRHLANALAAEIMLRNRILPLREWYTPRIEQLPAAAQHIIIIPPGITRAVSARSMFTWQVTLFKGAKQEEVIECTSSEEAEMMALLINLGKRYIEMPSDPPLIAEVLTLAKTFSVDLEGAIKEHTKPLPEDIRETIADEVRAVMVAS